MPRLHPTIIVSSVALCALLGCEHKIAVVGEGATGDKGAGDAPERATGAVAAAGAAASSTHSEARQALEPRLGREPAPGNADAPVAASERVPTSGASNGDKPTREKSGKEEAAGGAPAASGEGPDQGSPSDTCVQGWTTPRPGSKLRKDALDMIREQGGERFVVLEMRYFVGPEDAEVIGPPREVERWYIKARSITDRSRHQRWLLRRAAVGSGVDAVAAFDSTGYGPGTWTRPDALDPSTADPFQHPCDIARAGARCMGLPHAVLGCLQGT